MPSPTDRKYTKTHEWVSVDGDVATIGITDHAQGELGDITYLELPDVGDAVARDQAFGILESVKAANDIFSPVDGEVIARNEDALASPEMINQSPFDRAWLLRIRVEEPRPLEQLMNSDEYEEFAASAGH
ncbi:MAG TPA: glycine cleavage system protein GcvH [Thermomicrobiales bacterium]|jgi:glycine cleavage system H protein|nr:glycine cleavage system protein GcvH [Thermomicrobiales bacterium]